ncbi:hypothetical protein J3A83DRAFT_3552296 [Scleroderma citrinum]
MAEGTIIYSDYWTLTTDDPMNLACHIFEWVRRSSLLPGKLGRIIETFFVSLPSEGTVELQLGNRDHKFTVRLKWPRLKWGWWDCNLYCHSEITNSSCGLLPLCWRVTSGIPVNDGVNDRLNISDRLTFEEPAKRVAEIKRLCTILHVAPRLKVTHSMMGVHSWFSTSSPNWMIPCTILLFNTVFKTLRLWNALSACSDSKATVGKIFRR